MSLSTRVAPACTLMPRIIHVPLEIEYARVSLETGLQVDTTLTTRLIRNRIKCDGQQQQRN